MKFSLTLRRHGLPPVRLARFQNRRLLAHCDYPDCRGLIVVISNPATLQARWEKIHCGKCGQRYFVLPIDRPSVLAGRKEEPHEPWP